MGKFDASVEFAKQSFVRKVFMHKANVDMNEEATKKLIDELWSKYDTDGNGQLDRGELKKFIGDIQGKMAMDVEQGDYFNLIRSKFDQDGDEKIEKSEMHRFIKQVISGEFEAA